MNKKWVYQKEKLKKLDIEYSNKMIEESSKLLNSHSIRISENKKIEKKFREEQLLSSRIYKSQTKADELATAKQIIEQTISKLEEEEKRRAREKADQIAKYSTVWKEQIAEKHSVKFKNEPRELEAKSIVFREATERETQGKHVKEEERQVMKKQYEEHKDEKQKQKAQKREQERKEQYFVNIRNREISDQEARLRFEKIKQMSESLMQQIHAKIKKDQHQQMIRRESSGTLLSQFKTKAYREKYPCVVCKKAV